MSDYRHEKVLRVPYQKYGLGVDTESWDFCMDFENEHQELFGGVNNFQFAPTDLAFLDYLLFRKYDCSGEFGKTRSLYPSEKEKYLPIFQQLIPEIDMDDVRLVEYCWYDGTEAPDYYDESTCHDDFYDEV